MNNGNSGDENVDFFNDKDKTGGDTPDGLKLKEILSFNKSKEKEEHHTFREELAPSPYDEKYKMNHAKRGLAVIFNHVEFSITGKKTRNGSDKDRDDLLKLFRDLKFDVMVHDDLTKKEIKKELHTISQMDHTDGDCLVVVVMTHGNNEFLYASDKKYEIDTLWRYFGAGDCTTLAGKPKLFFIQACRAIPGKKVEAQDSYALHYQPNADVDVTDSKISPVKNSYTIPVMADILVMYSTVEGFSSFRDPINGSYFVQALVNQLRSHYQTRDLLTILTFVNREVAIDFTSPKQPKNSNLSERKQMCSVVSMLTRLMYFCDDQLDEQ